MRINSANRLKSVGAKKESLRSRLRKKNKKRKGKDCEDSC